VVRAPREFIAQGNKVVVLSFERGRVKATGRVVDNDYVHVFTVSEGKMSNLACMKTPLPIIAAIRDQEAI